MIMALLNILVWLLIIGLILGGIRYVLARYPLPAPFAGAVDTVLVVIALIILIVLLLQLVGAVGEGGGFPRLIR
jgi:hypothetical protein